jgi:UDP-N-acetylglucosamine:LPS N-acetylglucosamine transferase
MKVVAIASVGGHWVELLRLMPAFAGMELVFVSTRASLAATVAENKFYTIPDANRWNKFRLVVVFLKVFKIIYNEKPGAVISTGAAPGLMGLAVAKILGIKTIWVDTIASAGKLSMSGRIARKFADRIYTQWPNLAADNIIYAGNVLS